MVLCSIDTHLSIDFTMSIRQQIKQQKEANKESLKYFKDFEEHRRQQTDFILSSGTKNGRLCVLGAGNCFDMDLARITAHFAEVHLVDIDRDAIRRAQARLSGAAAKKVILHGPVDVSGCNKHLENWRDCKVTPETLFEFPENAAGRITAQLPGPFDCVVSSCLISQILFTCTEVMGEQHPLLQAALITLLVTHLRVMVALTKHGGRALWITDVSSNRIAPLSGSTNIDNKLDLLDELASRNQIFNYLDPMLIRDLALQDPYLSAKTSMDPLQRAWLWRNGPQDTFLVYGFPIAVCD